MEFISIISNCEFMSIIILLLKQNNLVFASENKFQSNFIISCVSLDK